MHIIKKLYSWILNNYRQLRNYFFGYKEYQKIVIICQARTGSNLLISLLNSHPNLVFGGEIFDFLKGRSSTNIWNNYFKKFPKTIKAVGFKIFYEHPFDGETDVWDIIKNDKSILIVHLTRDNLLRSFVSKKIALKTQRWHESINSKDIPIDKKVLIDLDEFYRYVNKVEKNIAHTQIQFSETHNYIEFFYEKLVTNRQNVLNELFITIGVSDFQVSTKMIRQNAEQLKELIENFEEIEEKFKFSKLKSFLD